jgi:hypothetical protein
VGLRSSGPSNFFLERRGVRSLLRIVVDRSLSKKGPWKCHLSWQHTHRNVKRCSINGFWSDKLASGTAAVASCCKDERGATGNYLHQKNNVMLYLSVP